MNALQSFFVNEWYFAAPMTLMAFVAFALVAWRVLLNFSSKTSLDDLWPDLKSISAWKPGRSPRLPAP